jgi:Periplasmic protease
MNINYVYWDIDTTNWDAMYVKYKPIFAQLDIKNASDKLKSVQYFRDMTKGLIDGHYHISFSSPLLSSYSVYPSYERKQKLPNFHYPYLYYNIDTTYLDSNYHLGFDKSNSYNGKPLTVLSGTINNKILFFSCSNFSLLKSYYSAVSNDVQISLNYFFNKLLDLTDNIKGVVIDVRGNQGGDIGDLNFLIGHFIDKPLHFGYTQSKSGNGRLEYTPWIKAIVNPGSNAKAIKVPIIVLADLNSASLSEAVVMAIKALPNSLFVGETTWGATGPILEEEVYNAGQFVITNYLSVLTSSCKFKYLDNKIYEGKGFSPDILVPFNSIEIIEGKDSQLEKAIDLLR